MGVDSSTGGRMAGRVDFELRGVTKMLGWALTFLVIALVAGVLGFGGVAIISVEIARLLFFVFLVLFAVSLIAGLLRGSTY